MATDDLRARIAASIMDNCHGVYVDDAFDAADAVIAELGLRYEYENGQILYHPKPKAASGNGNWRWRVSSDLIPYEG